MSQHTLKDTVIQCLEDYFETLEDTKPADLHSMIMHEVEAALFSTTLKYADNNQCRAAEYLGMNRGTMRKKLKQHDLI